MWLCAIATLFFAVNGLLTALPVVTYNPIFGSVLRFGSIPLADGYIMSVCLSARFWCFNIAGVKRPYFPQLHDSFIGELS